MNDGNLIYDTQGTQDTHLNESNDTINNINIDDNINETKNDNNANTQDEKMNEIINQDTSILNKIQREIYRNGDKSCNLVKIIWIVKCANRADAHLQFQAKFINKFNFLELNKDGLKLIPKQTQL